MRRRVAYSDEEIRGFAGTAEELFSIKRELSDLKQKENDLTLQLFNDLIKAGAFDFLSINYKKLYRMLRDR